MRFAKRSIGEDSRVSHETSNCDQLVNSQETEADNSTDRLDSGSLGNPSHPVSGESCIEAEGGESTSVVDAKDRVLEWTASKLERSEKMNSFLLSLSASLRLEKEELEARVKEADHLISELEASLSECDELVRKLHLRFARNYRSLFEKTTTAISRVIDHHYRFSLPAERPRSRAVRPACAPEWTKRRFSDKRLLSEGGAQAGVDAYRSRRVGRAERWRPLTLESQAPPNTSSTLTRSQIDRVRLLHASQ